MAGRTPAQAFDAFREPIQKALACISDAVFRTSPRPREPGEVHAITTARQREDYVSLTGPHRLSVSATIHYSIEKTDDPDRGPWKVCTRGYWYHIVTEDQAEVILFHWHPDSQSDLPWPHAHVGSSQITSHAVLSGFKHVPTGRVSLESVIRSLITDMGVVPKRPGWEAVLDDSEDRFRQWRTWG